MLTETDSDRQNRVLQDLRAHLRDFSFKEYSRNPWFDLRSLQPAILLVASRSGIRYGYLAFSEVRQSIKWTDEDLRYIDLVFFNPENMHPSIAIEIDAGVKKRSVKRINTLSEYSVNDVMKIIISRSPNSTYIKEQKEENLPDDFHHIDVELYKDWRGKSNDSPV